jgi:hypothetical protein
MRGLREEVRAETVLVLEWTATERVATRREATPESRESQSEVRECTVRRVRRRRRVSSGWCCCWALASWAWAVARVGALAYL